MSDLIRREDAIDAVMNTEPVFAVDSLEPYQKTKDVVEALEAIPSADRPQGEWIKDNLGTVICSECKRPRRDNRVNHINFCNSCGAKMVKDDE